MQLFSSIARAGKAVYRSNFPASKYTLVGRLCGPLEAILSISAMVCHDETILVAGGCKFLSVLSLLFMNLFIGKDGLYLWAMPSMMSIATPDPKHPRRGAVTTTEWYTNNKDACQFLAFGTVYGYLVFWKRTPLSVSYVSVKNEYLTDTRTERLRRGFLEAARRWCRNRVGEVRYFCERDATHCHRAERWHRPVLDLRLSKSPSADIFCST